METLIHTPADSYNELCKIRKNKSKINSFISCQIYAPQAESALNRNKEERAKIAYNTINMYFLYYIYLFATQKQKQQQQTCISLTAFVSKTFCRQAEHRCTPLHIYRKKSSERKHFLQHNIRERENL